jgi:hypothetical protein
MHEPYRRPVHAAVARISNAVVAMSTERYRQTQLSDDAYLRAWVSLRQRRRNMWIVFFAWPFAIAVGIKILHFLTGALENQIAPYVAIPVFLMAFVLMATFSFPCPRCGKEFYRKNSYRNPFSKECLNCRIRVGTPKNAPTGEPIGPPMS